MMTPKKWRLVFIIGVAVSLIVIAMGIFARNDEQVLIFCVLGLALFALSLICAMVFWRCPSCRRMLPLRGSIGFEYCPYCSSGLDEPK